VIDPGTQKCLSIEKPIQWDQTGPPGLNGAPGPAGPRGPKGDTGPAGPASGITSFDALNGTPCSIHGTTGVLTISKPSTPSAGFFTEVLCLQTDAYEPNETQQTAALLRYPLHGSIFPAGDVDWYVLHARSLNSVIFYTYGATLDLDVYVDGSLFASASSIGPNGTSVTLNAVFGTPPSGTHDWVFHVKAEDSNAIAGYFLGAS
jgi:hypothetical protein